MEVLIIYIYNFLTTRKWFIFVFFCLAETLIFKKYTNEDLKDDPFKIIELGASKTLFYRVSNEKARANYMQLHIPFIVEKLFHLEHDIEYTSGSVKYVIRPFKEIFMVKDGKKTFIGRFAHSFIDNESYCQVFEKGDRCGFNKNVRWSARVQFSGSVDKLRVVRLIEGNLCNYEIRVVGDILTRKITNKDTIVYKGNKEGEEDGSANDEDEKEEAMHFKAFKMKLLGSGSSHQ
ncbi:hypothetical protein VCUG_00475 [Vavraia culicis subsp. floridensis]|uniref:Uncharacterized protein n=1 Tax=Vavraia culicis (isolate floridensis) TaxID=948595 RepID=L2GXG7_VAVCU|nr:uncharacterized protein VCUG_00475 [Vavraia culicis subsp. floridensis]ELA48052.1 hypothetical protein VCUG_00475 [Vavraia culicis subsp. floridensis]